ILVDRMLGSAHSFKRYDIKSFVKCRINICRCWQWPSSNTKWAINRNTKKIILRFASIVIGGIVRSIIAKWPLCFVFFKIELVVIELYLLHHVQNTTKSAAFLRGR